MACQCSPPHRPVNTTLTPLSMLPPATPMPRGYSHSEAPWCGSVSLEKKTESACSCWFGLSLFVDQGQPRHDPSLAWLTSAFSLQNAMRIRCRPRSTIMSEENPLETRGCSFLFRLSKFRCLARRLPLCLHGAKFAPPRHRDPPLAKPNGQFANYAPWRCTQTHARSKIVPLSELALLVQVQLLVDVCPCRMLQKTHAQKTRAQPCSNKMYMCPPSGCSFLFRCSKLMCLKWHF